MWHSALTFCLNECRILDIEKSTDVSNIDVYQLDVKYLLWCHNIQTLGKS